MSRSTKARESEPASMTFEAAMEELERIIERIEQGAIGLEESMAQRRRGEALLKRCRAILDHAEQEIRSVKGPKSADDDPGNNGKAA